MSETPPETMTYLLLVYRALDSTPAPVPADVFTTWPDASKAMADAGVLLAGDALHPVDTATTVMVKGEKVLLLDGPFAETKEHLIGYYCIRVANLDEALSWARRLPALTVGSVEVRPVQATPASATHFLP
jgi:hypothetical protein